MPTYEVKMPNGRMVELTGDSPPTEQELEALYESMPKQSKMDYVRGLAQSLQQGLTFGWGDEISAAIQAPFYAGGERTLGEAYSMVKQNEAQNLDQFREENPATSMGVEVGGAVGSAIGGGTAALATKTVQNLPKLGRMVVPGAFGGGVYGAGAEESGERLEGGAKGAVIGGAFGAAAPAAARVAGRVGGWIEGAWAGLTRGDESKALERIYKAFADDGIPLGSVPGRLDNMSSGATLMDAGGENVRGLVEGVANRPGPGRQVIAENLGKRNQAVDADIVAGAERLNPKLAQLEQEKASILTRMRAAASPKYANAYSTEINSGSPVLQEMMQNPEIKKVWKSAIDEARSDVRLPDYVRRAIDPDAPNIAVWDAVKKKLDDKIRAARIKKPNKAARLGAIRDRLLKDLDQQVPDYAEARKIWSDDAGVLDALDSGLQVFKGDKSMTLAEFKAMPQAERESFRLGAARAIADAVNNTGRTLDDELQAGVFNKVFGSNNQRDLLKELFPDAESFGDFAKIMQSERAFRRNSNQAMRNSRTSVRDAQAAADGAGSVAADMVDAATGSPAGVAVRMLRRFKPSGVNEAADRMVAETLTATDTQAIKAGLKAIEDAPGWAKGVQKMSPVQLTRWLSNPQNLNRLETTLSGTTGTGAVALSQ